MTKSIDAMNFIDGGWTPGSGAQFQSIDPTTGNAVLRGQISTQEEVHKAVSAASAAFPTWSRQTSEERLAALTRFKNCVEAKAESLADAISREVGKPLWESRTEVSSMIGKLAPSQSAFSERLQEKTRAQGSTVIRTRFRPHGVVAVIGPYNFPGHIPNGHIVPALLAGNTVVFKPSEHGALTAQLTMECWAEAGLPRGVINLTQGDTRTGEALVRHPTVRAVLFTGSRDSGRRIYDSVGFDKLCALEMGGNSGIAVWRVADLRAAVFATIQSAFITSGQRCSAARRLIVERGASGDAFLGLLSSATRALIIGAPQDRPEPYMGPLRHPQMVTRLLEKQEQLIGLGGEVVLRAERLALGPAFVSPGILDVPPEALLDDEEILGPFLRVFRVSSFDEAIATVNRSEYGLAAGLLADDANLYQRFAEEVDAGIINWNQQLTGASAWAPFGGIKHSGNYRPSAFLAADYCAFATGSMEQAHISIPPELPPGLQIPSIDQR